MDNADKIVLEATELLAGGTFDDYILKNILIFTSAPHCVLTLAFPPYKFTDYFDLKKYKKMTKAIGNYIESLAKEKRHSKIENLDSTAQFYVVTYRYPEFGDFNRHRDTLITHLRNTLFAK